MNRCIAIIPARGGSKRIPGKNIRHFEGSPIIRYSIEAALQSGTFQEVMVSTDDDDIAKVARSFGAHIPFLRSAQNSSDYATTSEVILEVLEHYQKTGNSFDYACCIYPTAPFVNAEKIKAAYRLLLEANASTVLPVVRYAYPIFRALKMEQGQVDFLWPEHRSTRSQDLQTAYHDAGQFYFMNVNDFFEHRQIINSNTQGFEVPETEVQDIDNESDWAMAELKFKMMQHG